MPKIETWSVKLGFASPTKDKMSPASSSIQSPQLDMFASGEVDNQIPETDTTPYVSKFA